MARELVGPERLNAAAELLDKWVERGEGGRRCEEPSHVYVAIDLVRRLAAPQVSTDWDAGFDKMLGFAEKMGWVDETGTRIHGHTEWRFST